MTRIAKPVYKNKDWFGTEYWVYTLGEETQESLMLTGGLKGDCRAAVNAVVAVAEEISVSKKAYIAPTFDPTGFNGIGYIKHRASRGATEEICDVGQGAQTLSIMRVGNLLVAYPEKQVLKLSEVMQILEKCIDIESLEGLYVALSTNPKEESPASIFHVENARLRRLDDWEKTSPGHVSEVLELIAEIAPALYVELGCECSDGNGVEIRYGGKTQSSSLEDMISIVSIQLEEELGIAPATSILALDKERAFHRALSERGIHVIQILAGTRQTENVLRLAALSLINSFAFFSI